MPERVEVVMTKFLDLTGKKFGRLTCIKRVDRPEGAKQGTFWEVLCDCGTTCTLPLGSFSYGGTVSCGCYRKERALIDLTGKVFGRLTAISRVTPADKRKDKLYWKCSCSCGNTSVVTTSALNNGFTLSCGCLQKEAAKTTMTTHGKSGTEGGAYGSWKAMRSRCNNLNNPDHKYYSDIGIKVCDRWNDFENFLADMGERPEGEYSIDRRDSDLDYTPENCYWATPLQQRQSIKKSIQWIPVKINGVFYKNITEARRVLGLTNYKLKKLNELKNETTNKI